MQKRLELSDYPLKLWSIGVLIIVLGLFILFNLVLNTIAGKGVGFFDEGHWWQYIVGIGIVVLGASFILAGSMRFISMDKEVNFDFPEYIYFPFGFGRAERHFQTHEKEHFLP